MKRNKILILSIMILNLSISNVLAQNTTVDKYNEFKKKREAAYNKYKQNKDEAFTEYLRKTWEKYQSYKGDKSPSLPEPVKPVIHDNSSPTTKPIQLPLNPISIKPVIPEIKDPQKVPETFTTPTNNIIKLNFYGTVCSIRDIKTKTRLKSISENDVADAWSDLASSAGPSILNDYISIGKELQLNDWGYLELAKTISGTVYPNMQNEQTLLQGYLLTNIGVDIRLVRIANKLVLAASANESIYDNIYIKINNNKYYLINCNENGDIYTFKENFDSNVKPLSMTATRPLKLDRSLSAPKAFTSKAFPEMTVAIQYNENLSEFYNNYPHCDWAVYAGFPLDKQLEQTIIKKFTPILSGKNESEIANMLLNFVQTAFKYKTDDEQFGYERTLFAEEVFKYPYSDCEDRAVLFTHLIRIFLNRPVVLLNYPNHIATAVLFSENIEGDYVIINNKKYIVCDPTYIGAPIGEAMPQFKNVSAKVIHINTIK